jgi:hypothetical protein
MSAVVCAVIGAAVGVISWATAAMFIISTVMQQRQADKLKKAQEEAAARADAAKGFQISTEGESKTLAVLYGRNCIAGTRVYHLTTNNYYYAAPPAGYSTVTYNSGTGIPANSNIDAMAGGWLSIRILWSLLGGPMTYTQSGEKHQFLFVQQALCTGNISGCFNVTIDDRLHTDKDFNYGLKINIFPEGGVVDPLIVANDSTRANAVFTNTPYSTCVFKLNRDEPQYHGVPNVKFFVTGAKVHSITGSTGSRTLSTTITYSNNPALCLLDYLTNTSYGKSLSTAQIDLDSFYDASVICDMVVMTNISKDGYVWTSNTAQRDLKLFECNITIDTAKTIRDNIELILDTMHNAELLWSAGKYKLCLSYPVLYQSGHSYAIGQEVQYDDGYNINIYKSLISSNTSLPTSSSWSLMVRTIGDEHIVRGNNNATAWPNAQARFNFVTIRFLNEAKEFAEDSVSWPPKTTAITTGNNRGAFSSSNFYAVNDTVVYNGLNYILRQQYPTWNTAGGTVPYNLGDVVIQGGNVYKSKIASNTNVPTDTATWLHIGYEDPAVNTRWVFYSNDTVYQTYLTEDSGVLLESEFFETGISDYYHALAKAEQRVRGSRYNTVYNFKVTNEFFDLEPGDYVSVNSEILGIPSILMRVTEVKPGDNGEIELTTNAFDASILAWNAKDTEIVVPHSVSTISLDQAASITFAGTKEVATSVGTLTWNKADDIRVNNYIIKYTTTPVASIDDATVWVDIGTTSGNTFEVPALKTTGPYVFAIVASSNKAIANRDNWPLISTAIDPISFGPKFFQALSVYYRGTSAPGTPTGGTYSFPVSALTVVPTGWSATVPSGIDDLYASRTIASSDTGDDIVTGFTWETPSLIRPAPISVSLSVDNVGVLQDYTGYNYGFSNTAGNINVIDGTQDKSRDASVAYSIGAQDSCTVSLVTTTGSTKGNYIVTALTGDIGYFVLHVEYKFVSYDLRVNVYAVKQAYVRDVTPPPTPSNITIITGLSTVFINTTGDQAYTEGHGHQDTIVYGAVGATPIFSDAVEIQRFKGTSTTIASSLGRALKLWFKNHSVDNVISTTPYGGTNGADATTGKIGNSDLNPLIIEAGNLADGSVTTAKILAGNVTTTTLAANAVTTAKIALDSITTALIAADAVTTTEIADNSISTGKIVANAITAAKIAANTITATQIFAGTITTTEIAADTITTANIAANAITATEIAADAINANHLSANSIAVGTAAIQNGAIANAMIGNLTADKILTGTLQAGVQINVGSLVAMHSDGWIESYSVAGSHVNDYARIDSGQVSLYKYVGSLGYAVQYSTLSRIETGVCTNATNVVLPGYWKTQPKVIVSPNSLQLYSVAYAAQNQTINCTPNAITETGTGTMQWQFTPTATLNLAAATGSTAINTGSGDTSAANWTSATYTTAANCANITPSVSVKSQRGNGASQYLYRTVQWRVEYWNGSSWVLDTLRTLNMPGDTTSTVTDSYTFTFPSAGTWSWRIYTQAYDTSTALFGAISYTYSQTTVTAPTPLTYTCNAANPSTTSAYYALGAATGTGEIYQMDYTMQWEIDCYTPGVGTWDAYIYAPLNGTLTVDHISATNQNGATLYHPGPSSTNYSTYTYSRIGSSLTYITNAFYISVNSTPNLSLGASLVSRLKSGSVVIKRRVPVVNTTTPTNNSYINNFGFTLSTAQVLATGTLNWMAVL